MKNGIVRTISLNLIFPRSHQQQSNKINGRVTTDDLLRMARRNDKREITYHFQLADRSSGKSRKVPDFRNVQMLRAKKTNDNVFLSSVIHATEATQTGCKAKTRAAHQAG